VLLDLQYREKLLVGADQLREIRDEFEHQVHLANCLMADVASV
jgi:hypothetical protein